MGSCCWVNLLKKWKHYKATHGYVPNNSLRYINGFCPKIQYPKGYVPLDHWTTGRGSSEAGADALYHAFWAALAIFSGAKDFGGP